MANSVIFSGVMEEYGSLQKEKADIEETAVDEKCTDPSKPKGIKKGTLMQEEERLTGSVAGEVYLKYFRFAGGVVRLPIILVLLVGFQGSSGASMTCTWTFPIKLIVR